MKFANLPKKIPIGATKEIKSKNIYEFILCFLLNQKTAIITPIKPP